MNEKGGIWKKVVTVALRYYLGICLEGLRTPTKILSQDNLSPGRDLTRCL